MYRLSILSTDGRTLGIRRVGCEPVLVGRAPSNDVVLREASVSSRHLAIWAESAGIWVEDLGSRNGTWLEDGTALRRAQRFAETTRVRLGARIELELAPRQASDDEALLVEAIDDGFLLPIRQGRFLIGPRSDHDLQIDIPNVISLLSTDDGLAIDDGDGSRDLDLLETFEVAGRSYRVRLGCHLPGMTEENLSDDFPYRVTARLDGSLGPFAEIRDLRKGTRHEIRGENRAVLLYILARQRRQDLAAPEHRPEDLGWVDDERVSLGVWGRGHRSKNLNVLVARVRAELREAGFAPEAIEKRRGNSRLRVQETVVPTDSESLE